MRSIVLILLLTSCVFSQEILSPNKSYTFKEGMIAFTVPEFDKLDSLLADTLRLQKKIGLLEEKARTTQQLELKLTDQVDNLQSQVNLGKDKIKLLVEREELITQKAEVYKELFNDMAEELDKKSKRNRFSNNTFWFGTGTIVGAAVIYISSIIISNVN